MKYDLKKGDFVTIIVWLLVAIYNSTNFDWRSGYIWLAVTLIIYYVFKFAEVKK